MQFIQSILPYLQVVLSIFLIVTVLLQQRGSSVGGAFGAESMGTTFYTRRGAERVLFQITIGIAILFALSVFAARFV